MTTGSFRGYKAIQEALVEVAPLADWLRQNRPEVRHICVTRNYYDLFKRWPLAGKAQPVPIDYDDSGRITFCGFELHHDKSIGRYVKPIAPEQADLVSA